MATVDRDSVEAEFIERSVNDMVEAAKRSTDEFMVIYNMLLKTLTLRSRTSLEILRSFLLSEESSEEVIKAKAVVLNTLLRAKTDSQTVESYVIGPGKEALSQAQSNKKAFKYFCRTLARLVSKDREMENERVRRLCQAFIADDTFSLDAEGISYLREVTDKLGLPVVAKKALPQTVAVPKSSIEKNEEAPQEAKAKEELPEPEEAPAPQESPYELLQKAENIVRRYRGVPPEHIASIFATLQGFIRADGTFSSERAENVYRLLREAYNCGDHNSVSHTSDYAYLSAITLSLWRLASDQGEVAPDTISSSIERMGKAIIDRGNLDSIIRPGVRLAQLLETLKELIASA